MALKHRTLKVFAPDETVTNGHRQPLASSEELLNQLVKERARLSATLDSLMDPHVIFEAVRDERGDIVDFTFSDANDAAIAYNRSTREEMIGARLLDILPGHKSSGVFATYVHAVETGEPMILDDSVYYNEVHGSWRHCDVRALKVGDGLSYTWRDVTERAQLIEKYRLLAENASDIVFETDVDGTLKWMSPSTQSLGWDAEKLLGTSAYELIFGADQAKARLVRERLEKGAPGARFEARFRAANGDVHWMSVSVKPLRDCDGTTTAFVAGLRGIDTEIATRHSLAKSEEHFRLVAENSSDVLYETDVDGIIRWISPSVHQVLGYLPSALIGTRSIDLVAKDDFVETVERHELVIAGKEVGRVQMRLRTATGELRWMAVRAHPARGSSDDIIGSVVALRDCQSEVAAQRAANTLSAGSQVLVRSENEADLFAEMCQAAVDEGGYRARVVRTTRRRTRARPRKGGVEPRARGLRGRDRRELGQRSSRTRSNRHGHSHGRAGHPERHDRRRELRSLARPSNRARLSILHRSSGDRRRRGRRQSSGLRQRPKRLCRRRGRGHGGPRERARLRHQAVA